MDTTLLSLFSVTQDPLSVLWWFVVWTGLNRLTGIEDEEEGDEEDEEEDERGETE